MLNSLFTFDLDVVLFHIFIGLIQYLIILTLGINFLKLFRESVNPVLVYPSGLFIFSIFIILVWNINVSTPVVLSIISVFLIYNYKKILDYLNYQILNRFFLLILIIIYVVFNNTILHDPDSRNGVQAYGDTYFYIYGIYSDLNIYSLSDLSMYDTTRYLNQQIGIILAYPFRNFDLFRPILNFSISAWILSLIFVGDILRKNIQISFVSYQVLVLSFLVYFSFRMNYYLDESLPTILTIPLIFLLSFFLFENFNKEKIILEIFLFLITIFLCLLTKQVLLLLAIPILFFRGLMSGKKKIVYLYLFLIFVSVSLILFFHIDHLERSFNLIKIKSIIPELFIGTDNSNMGDINRIFQLISLVILTMLTYRNGKLISIIIFSIFIFFNSSSGGPYFFWMMLFIVYSIQKYEKVSFLNTSVNKYFLYLFILFSFLASYYLFYNYHYKIGIYFLFFIFLFSAFNTQNLKNNLKIIIIILSITFPLSFSLKIPTKINFLIKSPLQNGKSLIFLNKKIKEIVPENSIIFTDIAIKNYTKDLNNYQKLIEYSRDPGINYLTQSKRQFYLLSSNFFYDKPKFIEKFYKMLKHNQDVIYKDEDPKEIINNNNFNNYFMLTKKENLNKISRLKKYKYY